MLTEEERIAHIKQSAKAWRERNKEKEKIRRHEYFLKNKERLLANDKKRRLIHPVYRCRVHYYPEYNGKLYDIFGCPIFIGDRVILYKKGYSDMWEHIWIGTVNSFRKGGRFMCCEVSVRKNRIKVVIPSGVIVITHN